MRNILPFLALIGCYDPPLKGPEPEPLNNITGSVTLFGPDQPAQTIVLAFDAESPGPPAGTTGPTDFSVVNAWEFTGESETGFSGPFAVTSIPDGAYELDAIVDMDGNFNPVAFTLAGATCGDWQGSHWALDGSGTKGHVPVSGGLATTDIPVTIDTQLKTERPAFQLKNPVTIRYNNIDGYGQNYNIVATDVHTSYDSVGGTIDKKEYPDGYLLDMAPVCETDPDDPLGFFCAEFDECVSAFELLYVDNDGDGVMDSHPDYDPGFGLKDVWPRVLVEYLGTVDYDDDGNVVADELGYPIITPPDLPEGEYWATENFTWGFEAVANINVTGVVNQPVYAKELKVFFPPLIAHFYPEWNEACGDTPPEDLTAECSELIDLADPDLDRSTLPKGAWGINIINWQGQTWGIPNEIAEWGLPSTDAGFEVSTQAGVLLTK